MQRLLAAIGAVVLMGCAQVPEGTIVSVESYGLVATSGCDTVDVAGVDTCRHAADAALIEPAAGLLQQVVGDERAAAVLAGGV
jgi:hypothetical protein